MNPNDLGLFAHMDILRRLLTLSLLLACLLTAGCADSFYAYQRTVWGADCRPEKLNNGQCVPVGK